MKIRLSMSSYLEDTHAGQVMQKYVGKGYFIHFGRTEKLGVKTNPIHNDPYGVYFYSVGWLLENASYDQYALKFPYFSIIKLDRATKGVVLTELDNKGLASILEKSNSLSVVDSYIKAMGDTILSVHPAKQLIYLYHYAQEANMKANILKGIAWLEDTGEGFFNRKEPNQLLVRDPKCYTLIEKGKTFERTLLQGYYLRIVDLIGKPSKVRSERKEPPWYTLTYSREGLSNFTVHLMYVRESIHITILYKEWNFDSKYLYRTIEIRKEYAISGDYTGLILKTIRDAYNSYSDSKLLLPIDWDHYDVKRIINDPNRMADLPEAVTSYVRNKLTQWYIETQ